jgi:cytochrome b involved in lipid metabolism
MKKVILILVVVFLISLSAGLFLLSNEASAPQPKELPTTTQSLEPGEESSASFTTEEVSERNSRDSCWTIINGGVYDITRYISRHPGGEEEILKACGNNSTNLFNGSDSNGRPGGHSGSAQSQLESFKIGVVDGEPSQ